MILYVFGQSGSGIIHVTMQTSVQTAPLISLQSVALLLAKATLFNFLGDYGKFLGVQKLKNFTILLYNT